MNSFDNPLSDFLFASLQWLSGHYIEILATITGLIYVIYSVQGKILLWLFGLVSSLLYVVVFYRSGIYALMSINMYYVIISIYGWFHWTFPGSNTSKKLPISRLKKKLGLYLLLLSLVFFGVIAFILKEFTNSDVVSGDAFITAFSITATWMLARKIMEHWLVWIVVDLIAMILYLSKELYPTVLLFLIYTVLAVVGFMEWNKQWKNQERISAE